MSSAVAPKRPPLRPVRSAASGKASGRQALSLRDSRQNWPIRTVFQPLIDLRTGRAMGVEALTRARTDGRETSSILEMFRDAATERLVSELDWLCQRSAIQTWLALEPDEQLSLFINVEPESVGRRPPAWVVRCLDALEASPTPTVIELTERGLGVNPRDLLHFRDRVRERGWKLAIDDIGAARESLAMIPVVEPDVLKLDMQLLHGAPTASTARVVNAVLAHASRTGAQIVAEGIETLEHLELAISCGADLGQGWLFDRPAAGVPARTPRMMPRRPSPATGVVPPDRASTPWELVSGHHEVRRATKPLLAAMSHHIELQVDQCDGSAVVVACFQHRDHLTAGVMRRFARFSRTATFVGVLGTDIDPTPAPDLRGCALDQDDPLEHEWSLVVISPFFCAALIAHDTGLDAADEAERQFDYLVTYDRELATRAGRLLMRRFD